MNVLIVYAHPEPKSFNGAMKDLAVRTLTGQGHEVEVSDLYAMNFNPVAGRNDVLDADETAPFKVSAELGRACKEGTLAADIVAEQEKVRRADFVIMQAPMWWFTVPAIMKGWIDRVFIREFAFTSDEWYDTGRLAGKRAMLSMTTAAGPRTFQPASLFGDIHERLYSIQHCALYFVGFEVLPPFIAWAVDSVNTSKRRRYLEEYEKRLLTLDTTEAIPFLSPDDYDVSGEPKPGRTRTIAAACPPSGA